MHHREPRHESERRARHGRWTGADEGARQAWVRASREGGRVHVGGWCCARPSGLVLHVQWKRAYVMELQRVRAASHAATDAGAAVQIAQSTRDMR